MSTMLSYGQVQLGGNAATIGTVLTGLAAILAGPFTENEQTAVIGWIIVGCSLAGFLASIIALNLFAQLEEAMDSGKIKAC